MPKPYKKSKPMRLNAKKRYPVRGGGEADTEGVLSTQDVFGLFPEGQIGRMGIAAFRNTGAILWGHDGDMLPIGRATWIEFDGSQWTVGWRWAENEFAQQVKAEWDAGIITAMSVGMSVRFGDDFDVEDVQLREASVVSVGADDGAYVAVWDGPTDVVACLRDELGVRDLQKVGASRIMELAASMRPSITPAEEEEDMADNEATQVVEQPELAVEAQAEPEAQAAEQPEPVKSEPAVDAKPAPVVEAEPEPAAQPTPVKPTPVRESMLPEQPVTPAGQGTRHAQIVAAARDLVPEGFDIEGASTNAIMRAAISWEIGEAKASAMNPVELVEAFGAVVARRNAAMAALDKASEASEAKAEAWKERNEAPPAVPTGEAQGANHPAYKAMTEKLRNAWKRNNKEA